MSPKVSIIGSGVAGMAAACYMAKKGLEVSVFEKNDGPGGRMRQFSEDGFVFDMGPSWYWMPDVFEAFFNDFGKKTADYYTLKRLSPSYAVYFEEEKIDIPSQMDDLEHLFEQLETGSALRLRQYLADAKTKYGMGMQGFAEKPSLRLSEFITKEGLAALLHLQLFGNMEKHVSTYFKHPIIRKIMQFPVIFLGAMPDKIPAMYSLMNYADSVLGTWYPQGGMFEIAKAMYSLAKELGVTFRFNCDIDRISVQGKRAYSLHQGEECIATDLVLANGDYHHIESLLPIDAQSYSEKYWNSRQMAPSSLLYYIGINKKLAIDHHSLFFDTSFDKHAAALYNKPYWPDNPLFYVCAPSVSDSTVAPNGSENLFVLIPVAAGLQGDGATLRQRYLDEVLQRMEKKLGTSIKEHVVFQRSYAISDFSADYHAFKGNAYGLANTLMQTAIGKPRIKSKKVENLFYCGQLTVPGPGLPPAFLSGKIAAGEVLRYIKQKEK